MQRIVVKRAYLEGDVLDLSPVCSAQHLSETLPYESKVHKLKAYKEDVSLEAEWNAEVECALSFNGIIISKSLFTKLTAHLKERRKRVTAAPTAIECALSSVSAGDERDNMDYLGG